jgi:AcrR family transcriptional regulator
MKVNAPARAAAAEQRRDRMRERLLAAAESVVAEHGFDGVAVEAFVAAAGVSRGTFYNYFPTTADLHQALNERVAAHLDDLLERLARQPKDPASRLAASIHTVLAAYLSDPVRGWVALQIASSRAPRARSFESRFATLYEAGVRRGQFRPVEMTSAWTLAFGAIRMTQRDLVAGEARPRQAVQVVALVLAAFGVPYDEAERISREEAAAALRS